MHNGRRYPFHPNYWSTEAWFWPGFVPWRMHGEVIGPLNPPWNLIPPTWEGLSDAGSPDTDCKQIAYAFNASAGGSTCLLDLILDLRLFDQEKNARWRCYISGGGPAYAVGVALQDFPQRVVFLPSMDFSLPSPPYTSASGPLLSFRPATYVEGGSPYP